LTNQSSIWRKMETNQRLSSGDFCRQFIILE